MTAFNAQERSDSMIDHDYKVCMIPAFCRWHRAKFWWRFGRVMRRGMPSAAELTDALIPDDMRMEALDE